MKSAKSGGKQALSSTLKMGVKCSSEMLRSLSELHDVTTLKAISFTLFFV
jgi:hypothetical protein